MQAQGWQGARQQSKGYDEHSEKFDCYCNLCNKGGHKKADCWWNEKTTGGPKQLSALSQGERAEQPPS
eukprot:5381840-Pyramimonas_sp.AAC.1